MTEEFSYVIQPLQVLPAEGRDGIPTPAFVASTTHFEEVPIVHGTNNFSAVPSNVPLLTGPDIGILSTEEQPCIFQIVLPQPQDLDLRPNLLKRGRPKKKKFQEENVELKSGPEAEITPPNNGRTRSGRLVKLPKYIERDFKKIDISSNQEIQISNFHRFEEKENTVKADFAGLPEKKRKIKAQYRCPKCLKAYLGRNKMVQHLKKFPDHGPFPDSQNLNFDVWNYLFDVTQKCSAGQRGAKFCDELSNLLHNVQLLKTALFKKGGESKNCVNVDKVLGNALGLSPGKYSFNESELYKDVTIFNLVTNSDFFKPSESKSLDVDLLGDSLLVHSRNSDDVLMLPGHGVSLLDNSSGSDDVINVDQFVNERLRKIIDPDLAELGSSSLNLDLPALDIFQFNTS